MMQMQTFVLPRALLAAAAAALLAGCAAVGPASSSPEEAVKARANERWAALVKYDFAKAYTFMAPGYRAIHSEKAFRGRQGTAVQWKGAEVVEVRCPDATKCLAKVRIEAKPFMMRGFGDTIVTHAEETWLLEDGQWWLFERL